MVNKKIVTIVGHATQFYEYTEASFLPTFTDLLCLQLTQVLRSPDLAIFVSTMTTMITN